MTAEKTVSSPLFAPGAKRSEVADGLKQGLLLGVAVLALILPPAGMGGRGASATTLASHTPSYADFSGEAATPAAKYVANWVVDSQDNRNMSFVLLDKKDARVFVFDPRGKLLGATPVLLGAAPGDDSVEGIGQRPIAQVKPEERTTPAGRFVAELGRNATGEDVIWVDYDAAVSMHRVRALVASERRLERLATPTPDDNRISYGCINVPVAFFENVVLPIFGKRHGVVYVLPETKPVQEVFHAYDVDEKYGVSSKTASTAF